MALVLQPATWLNIGLWKECPAIKLPAGSPATSAVNGVPFCARKMPPSCHPCANQLTGPVQDFREGTSQRKLATKFCGMLKSDTPLLTPTLNGSGSFTELLNSSASKLEEESSMLLDSV